MPGSLYDFCYSSDTYLRSLYDKTYRFIKGTYEMPAPTLTANESLSVEAGSKRNRLPVTLEYGCLFSELSISVEGGEGVLLFSPRRQRAALHAAARLHWRGYVYGDGCG